MVKFNNPFNLKNKLIFIIGGNGLIGAESSTLLANLNAKVVVIDKNDKNRINNQTNIKFEKYNITNIVKIESNLKKLIKKYGVPDVFINCSYPKTKDWGKNNFKEIKYLTYKKNLQLHLDSYVWSSKFICDEMKKNEIKGSVILLNSIYGMVGQTLDIYTGTNIKENMTYSIIKGGLTNFVRQMASFYGKHGIRVNCICPGGIKDKNSKIQNKKFEENYIKKSLIKRLGNPNDISGAVAYLASDASNYVTGTNLLVDGGWTAV